MDSSTGRSAVRGRDMTTPAVFRIMSSGSQVILAPSNDVQLGALTEYRWERA